MTDLHLFTLHEDLEHEGVIVGYEDRYWFTEYDAISGAIFHLQTQRDGWPKQNYTKFGSYLGTLADFPELLL